VRIAVLTQSSRIPWTNTEFSPTATRKAQAAQNDSDDMLSEIKALRLLGEQGCKHSPHYVNELHSVQGDDGLVPTGYISYILMTWCPGVPLGEGDFWRKSKAEQARIFKRSPKPLSKYLSLCVILTPPNSMAYRDVKQCGAVSKLPGPGSLIWDAAANKW
jgi:hypothetical protein